jgi:hypothetical protein
MVILLALTGTVQGREGFKPLPAAGGTSIKPLK